MVDSYALVCNTSMNVTLQANHL